ncbi:PHA/PHB synthase family protein [Haloechinothrix halophila]|uniref:PHA/PHB synthase family protein n=1 Tax=Haloechinothrix halophila TaxID=1069073 RepID=UPI0003FC8392|nr:alpha/beta fold hydrolase [Haloechinothrix halophila]
MTRAEEAVQLAAPLDTLLIEAAPGPAQRFLPDASTAKFLGRLASRPRTSARTLGTLAAEYGRIVTGRSSTKPHPKDRRFTDSGWKTNPFLQRLVQAYVATGKTAEELIDAADLDWRDDTRVRFLTSNLMDAIAPSNVPLVNPISARVAVDYGGLSLAQGVVNFVTDMRSAPRIPKMVDGSKFTVGENLAVTPGSVVYRSEVFELIQYTPQTEQVRTVPMVLVPPTINKYYSADLAPGRSVIEYLVQNGLQVFALSWRNPQAKYKDWGLPTYVQAVLDAMDAAERITGCGRALMAGACSGGSIASVTAAYLAATGKLDRVAAFSLLVTVIDNTKAGEPAAFANRPAAEVAKAMSRRKGYLDGAKLAEGFAWLRPNDLIWGYWINNYLCGNKPPAFDILYWNSDTTRMAAQLHADFIDIGVDNALAQPGGVKVNDVPIDLSTIDVDSYVLAGISDHITPWQNCYRSVHLLGGETEFVLSRSGHIAALVNPPSNPKAKFQLNPKNPVDPQEWLAGATTEEGSWWPHWVEWLAARGGPERPAPRALGGGGLEPLCDAPGTYVFEK